VVYGFLVSNFKRVLFAIGCGVLLVMIETVLTDKTFGRYRSLL